MLEDRQMASAILQDTFKVKYFRHRALATGMTGEVLQMIRTKVFDFIFAEFPIAGRHIPQESMHKICSTICHWAKAAADSGTLFVLFGLDGKKWMEPQISAILDERVLHKAWHRACHFGIKIDATQPQPSSTCWVTASTMQLASHKCNCTTSRQDHVLDFKAAPSAGRSDFWVRPQRRC